MSPLTDAEFGDVRAYLVDEAGLVFDESRRAGLNATLADRMSTTGASGVAGYLATLRGKDGQAERQRLLDAVTVQETHFFRNPPQMEALRRKILPDLLRRAGGRTRPLTIWSAGCSTGEEPYTLAMLLLELSPMLGTQTQARILGTDVSNQALRAAGRATYTGRTLDATPPMVRDRWLEPEGSSWTVKEQARRLVELRLHNLVTDPAPFGPGEVDLIVCRNVTIYFDRETTAAIMAGFAGLLAEGGYLLLGHSETLWQMSEDFTVLPVGDAFVYRRSVDVPTEPDRGRSGPSDDVGSMAGPGRHVRTTGGRPGTALADTEVVTAPLGLSRPAVTRGADSRRDADLLLADARLRLAGGDYAAAALAAAQAVASDPLLAPAYLVLGQARSTLGQDGAAIDTLRKAVYLDPAGGHAHFLLAGALSRTSQYAAAAVSYRAAAAALAGMSAAERGELMDGRDAGELGSLCERLAVEALQAAAVADGTGHSTGDGTGSARGGRR